MQITMSRISLFLWCAMVFFLTKAQSQEPLSVANPIVATPDDYARFFAGLPLRAQSPLQQLMALPGVIAHSKETRDLTKKWESYRLAKIREWARAEIHPKISRPTVLKYMFGGPDFVHAATIFPEVPEYILVGLEPLGSIPDFFQMNPAQLESYLAHLSYSLRSISERNFFITKEMREDFGKLGLDGVFPILLYFSAMTGHDVTEARYVSLDPEGKPVICEAPAATGVWLQLRLVNPSPRAPAAINLYYFKTDLSDAGFHAGTPFHKFLAARPGGLGYLKAASYLMHTESFSNIRNFLVGDCQYMLQDTSGIPADFLALYYNLTYFGNYIGPIDMFSEHDQPGLRQIYQSGVAKPLPFGTGYRMRDEDSVQMFGVRK